jgi:hypothetical protein
MELEAKGNWESQNLLKWVILDLLPDFQGIEVGR